jgi:hypothetical protein
MNWIKIEDEMPESEPTRIIKGDELNPDKSVRVLVYTDCGSVYNNQRIKMQIGKKEWKWFIGHEDETITHWCRFLSPII